MRIQIVNGIYADADGDYRTSFPVNMRPVPKSQGISQGYLRFNEGATKTAMGSGKTRGGIEWGGDCYRVVGAYLVKVDADDTVEILGEIAGDDTVSMSYSFNRLAIAASGNLYYYDKSHLIRVTDPDLGSALDVVWVDGYFITTDGGSIIVTELLDPTQVDPLKYGSSEVDPDPIKAVLRVRNELFAVNRYTIEAFQNVGGTGFPFAVIRGAQAHKGAVGTHMCAVIDGAICFVGGGKEDAISVWIGEVKISTRDIDLLLQKYSDKELQDGFMEVQKWKGHATIYIHLRDETICYDVAASAALGSPVWYILNGDVGLSKGWPVRHFVWAHGKWMVGSPENGNLGYIDSSTGKIWGDNVGWKFETPIIYNEGAGAIINEIELICLTGEAAFGDDPTAYTQYSLDGRTWSQPRHISAGKAGQRAKRLRWMRNGQIKEQRIQRFGGTTKAPLAVSSINARVEPTTW